MRYGVCSFGPLQSAHKAFYVKPKRKLGPAIRLDSKNALLKLSGQLFEKKKNIFLEENFCVQLFRPENDIFLFVSVTPFHSFNMSLGKVGNLRDMVPLNGHFDRFLTFFGHFSTKARQKGRKMKIEPPGINSANTISFKWSKKTTFYRKFFSGFLGVRKNSESKKVSPKGLPYGRPPWAEKKSCLLPLKLSFLIKFAPKTPVQLQTAPKKTNIEPQRRKIAPY